MMECNAETDTEMQTYYSDIEMSRNYLPEYVNATVIQVPPLSQAGNPSSLTRMHGASGDSPIRVTASKVRSNEDIGRRDSDLEFSDTVEPKDTFRDMTVAMRKLSDTMSAITYRKGKSRLRNIQQLGMVAQFREIRTGGRELNV
jgi:hypothetical protein